ERPLSLCNNKCLSGYRKTKLKENCFAVMIALHVQRARSQTKQMYMFLTIGVLILVSLPTSVCKIPFTKCTRTDPSPILHKYHEPNEFILGGIISQSFAASEEITFKRHPFPEIFVEFIDVSFNNSAGNKISFDDNGEFRGGFEIINWVTFPNQSFRRVKVGTIDPDLLSHHLLNITEGDLIWPTWFNQIWTNASSAQKISIQTINIISAISNI
ncbi:hypothetical protein E2320_003428, partial [Naja naja]